MHALDVSNIGAQIFTQEIIAHCFPVLSSNTFYFIPFLPASLILSNFFAVSHIQLKNFYECEESSYRYDLLNFN